VWLLRSSDTISSETRDIPEFPEKGKECIWLMTADYELKRYAAYYKGWCQTFGEHESILSEDDGISWLFGDGQIGFITPWDLTKALLLEVLRKHQSPKLTISRNHVRIGRLDYKLSSPTDESALHAIEELLESGHASHIYLTSHFMYGMGTRILTLSSKKPVPIIYKEIGSMIIRLK
jgi:hypothetical protein